jgi:hypothetical protein
LLYLGIVDAKLRLAGWVVIGTLAAAGAYELALALGAGSLGPEPGDGIPGSWVIGLVAVLAMLAAAALAPFLRPRSWPAALFAPAAAAYLVAFYFTFDPYFAPQLRRYSDGGNVAGTWIAVVAVVALAAGILTRLRPRLGAPLTSVVLLVLVATTVLAGDGH